MPSDALVDLLRGIEEVRALRRYYPQHSDRKLRSEVEQAKIAQRRACVVLLCSHYERYIYGLNEVAVDVINANAPASDALPTRLRLLQTREIVDRLGGTSWEKREQILKEFVGSHSALWIDKAAVSTLVPTPHLVSMKSPKPAEVIRFFRVYGIENIVETVTRTEGKRREMIRALQGLVDARNGIAHGDQAIQPVKAMITSYIDHVAIFCTRVDRILCRQLATMLKCSEPW